MGSEPAAGFDGDKSGACLSGPKGAAPQGERWRYRVDRSTKRHCWYTRGGAARKPAEQRPRAAEPLTEPATLDPLPLQQSVANARAEADLSASAPQMPAPSDPPRTGESNGETWALAERWSKRPDAAPPAVLPTPQIAQPPTPQAKPPNTVTDPSQENLVEMAAGTIALLGLSMVLIVTLIRRRKQDWPKSDRHVARPRIGENESEAFTDLNDEPLMTWRKGPRDDLRMARRSVGHRGGLIRRVTD